MHAALGVLTCRVGDLVRPLLDCLIDLHVLRLPTTGLGQAWKHEYQPDVWILPPQTENRLGRERVEPKRSACTEEADPGQNQLSERLFQPVPDYGALIGWQVPVPGEAAGLLAYRFRHTSITLSLLDCSIRG